MVAEGFLRIAIDNMANAIKKISVQRGHDVTGYTLQCFGGAGGQHACGVADTLGMRRVFLHPFAGVLSAYGMGLADLRALREAQFDAPLSALADAKAASKRCRLRRVAELRAQGITERRRSPGRRTCAMTARTSRLPVPFGTGSRNARRL